MKKILLLCLVFGTTFFISANTFADRKKISGEGVIKIYTGIYYTGLVEHQLVKIKSDKNKNFKVNSYFDFPLRTYFGSKVKV